jgi:hypothetical protein
VKLWIGWYIVSYRDVKFTSGSSEREKHFMCDIALGMKESGLPEFAASVNASYESQWKELGFYDEEEESWGRAFEQVLTKTLAAGGRFHFKLAGLDIAAALDGGPNPEEWVHGHTAWELRQIVRKYEWFANTLFYLNGIQLTPDQVTATGIELHN